MAPEARKMLQAARMVGVARAHGHAAHVDTQGRARVGIVWVSVTTRETGTEWHSVANWTQLREVLGY